MHYHFATPWLRLPLVSVPVSSPSIATTTIHNLLLLPSYIPAPFHFSYLPYLRTIVKDTEHAVSVSHQHHHLIKLNLEFRHQQRLPRTASSYTLLLTLSCTPFLLVGTSRPRTHELPFCCWPLVLAILTRWLLVTSYRSLSSTRSSSFAMLEPYLHVFAHPRQPTSAKRCAEKPGSCLVGHIVHQLSTWSAKISSHDSAAHFHHGPRRPRLTDGLPAWRARTVLERSPAPRTGHYLLHSQNLFCPALTFLKQQPQKTRPSSFLRITGISTGIPAVGFSTHLHLTYIRVGCGRFVHYAGKTKQASSRLWEFAASGTDWTRESNHHSW